MGAVGVVSMCCGGWRIAIRVSWGPYQKDLDSEAKFTNKFVNGGDREIGVWGTKPVDVVGERQLRAQLQEGVVGQDVLRKQNVRNLVLFLFFWE